jgi:oligopeptidase B
MISPVIPTGFKVKRMSAKSSDGTVVYGAIVYKEHSEIHHCLVTGYGAYGIETSAGGIANRWYPLLENNWCILITFIRGGGDHTEEWGKAGRRYGRVKSVEDFKSLILQFQRANNISPDHTCIYGRSAGGLLMGITLAENPNGNLMRGVFTEVPYVDLLRTTTNPSLPLTELEYNEFGNPNDRLEDFITNGLMSPADSASIIGAPRIFVLTRTAENDSQVFTYESVKWIRRLRSHDGSRDAPKLCIVERGQGHFTPPDETIHQWAIDCALLDAWVDQNIK